MNNSPQFYKVVGETAIFQKVQFVLSGFALHLASHFGRSFLNHSYCYDSANDRPNCFAIYTANSGSFMQYAG